MIGWLNFSVHSKRKWNWLNRIAALVCRAVAPGNEEFAQVLGRFFIADPAKHIWPMMAGRLGKDSRPVNHAAALGILGCKS
jgi:hypothetical protein